MCATIKKFSGFFLQKDTQTDRQRRSNSSLDVKNYQKMAPRYSERNLSYKK